MTLGTVCSPLKLVNMSMYEDALGDAIIYMAWEGLFVFLFGINNIKRLELKKYTFQSYIWFKISILWSKLLIEISGKLLILSASSFAAFSIFLVVTLLIK